MLRCAIFTGEHVLNCLLSNAHRKGTLKKQLLTQKRKKNGIKIWNCHTIRGKTDVQLDSFIIYQIRTLGNVRDPGVFSEGEESSFNAMTDQFSGGFSEEE